MAKMEISRRDILRLSAAAGTALVPSVRRAGAANVNLTFWNTTYPTEDPNDKTKKLEDFYIYKALKRFEASHPGISVAIENIPSDASMFTKYRTASVAKNGPDVMGLWSGTYMLSLKDFLEPLASYFSPEERARITGWEAVAADFRPDSGQIYGVPAGSDGTTCIFYNKEIFAKAGIDPEQKWPQNVGEFLAMLEQIQASGTTAMALDEYAIVWQILAYWQAQMLGGSAVVAELVSGQRNFSDPMLVAIVRDWQKLHNYTVPGAETMQGSEAYQFLFQGQVAMTTAGFWIISDARKALGDRLGMVKIPNYSQDAPIKDGGIGGAGTAFIVSNYSAHKEEAVAFIKFLMSKEEQELKAESGEGSLLNVTDVDTTPYYQDPLKQIQQQWANEPSTIFWLDNLFPPDLTIEIKAQSQLAWTGQISAEEFMKRADAKRDDLLRT